MESAKKKESLKTKLVGGIGKFRAHWNQPPQGYQVAYKEFAAFSAGCGSPNLLGVLTQYTTIATSVHLMISYFRMSTGMAWLLTILASVIAIIRSPILSMMIDNSNGKNGKFKPFLLWSAIGTAVSFSFVPYIPAAWMDVHLFSIPLPAIPIMGVFEASTIDFNLGILLAFLLIQIGQFFITLLNQCIAGIEQTISTVAQERANIGSIKGLVSGLPSSIVNIILPIFCGNAFCTAGRLERCQYVPHHFPDLRRDWCFYGASVGERRAGTHRRKAGICGKGSLHRGNEAPQQKQIFLDYHDIQFV